MEIVALFRIWNELDGVMAKLVKISDEAMFSRRKAIRTDKHIQG